MTQMLFQTDGNYTFFNISSGTYNVRQLIPDGYSQTTHVINLNLKVQLYQIILMSKSNTFRDRNFL